MAVLTGRPTDDDADGRGDRRTTADADERLRRWRLVLGGGRGGRHRVALAGRDAAMDAALAALYDEADRRGRRRDRVGGARRRPRRRWPAGSGDIRTYFPSTVVQVMQADAIERLDLTRLLLEPEMLEAVEPDVHLVGTLLSLNRVMPETTKETARAGGRARWSRTWRSGSRSRTRAAVTGALNRAARINRPAPPRHRLEPHDPRPT